VIDKGRSFSTWEPDSTAKPARMVELLDGHEPWRSGILTYSPRSRDPGAACSAADVTEPAHAGRDRRHRSRRWTRAALGMTLLWQILTAVAFPAL
jgi:hypothetical protein